MYDEGKLELRSFEDASENLSAVEKSFPGGSTASSLYRLPAAE